MWPTMPDPGNLKLRTWINGELRRKGSTRDMIFDIPYLIEYLSSFMTLQPGDMIATGTPEKVWPMWCRAMKSSWKSKV